MALPEHFRRVRSFIRRDSRRTDAQTAALQNLGTLYLLPLEIQDFSQIFQREAPTFLEIGFGMGHSLLALAAEKRDHNFIGIETHQPGIGNLLAGIHEQQLTNLKIFYADAVDVLNKAIDNASLDGIQLFFPDPWPKRRHHERRLIQPDFVALIVKKLKPAGTLHLATDWEDYARHMMHVVSCENSLVNCRGDAQFGGRSPYRPLVTKFEARALRDGRQIRELQLEKLR